MVESFLPLGNRAGTDDAGRLVVSLGPYDQNETASRRADGDEAVLRFEEGRQEGEARLLLRQLRMKFGPLDPGTEERVRSADADRLLEWGERILSAESLEDIFRG